jgi:hypothetical protein
MPAKYSFQFNGDVASCTALADLIRSGWELRHENALTTSEGFDWIHLVRWTRVPGCVGERFLGD